MQIKQSITYLTSSMGASKIDVGPFTEMIKKYLMKFGEDADGKKRQPLKIPLYRFLEI